MKNMSSQFKKEKDLITNKNNSLDRIINKTGNNISISKSNLIYKKNVLSSIKDIPINTNNFNLTNSFLKNLKLTNFENRKSNLSSTSHSTNSTPLKIPVKENIDLNKENNNSKIKINEYQFNQLILNSKEIFLKIQKIYYQNNSCLKDCILWIENFKNIYENLIDDNKENEFFESIKNTLLIMFFSIIIIYDIVNQNKQKFFMEDIKNIINIHILMSESIYNNSFNNPNVNHQNESQVLLVSYKNMSHKIYKIITQYQRINLKNFQILFVMFKKLRNENYDNLYELFINKIKNPKHEEVKIQNNKNLNINNVNMSNSNINNSSLYEENINNNREEISYSGNINEKNISNTNTINVNNSFNTNTFMNNTINTDTINTNTINTNTINTINAENKLNITYQPQIKDTISISSGMGTYVNSNNYFYFRKPNYPKPSTPQLKGYYSTRPSFSSNTKHHNSNNLNINPYSFHQQNYGTKYLTPQRNIPKMQHHYNNNYYIQNDPRLIIQETIKNPNEEKESIFARFSRIKSESKKKEQNKNNNTVQKEKNIENNKNNNKYNNIETIKIDNNSNPNIGKIDISNLKIKNEKINNKIPLIPFSPKKEYCLVLDLDETLIHVPKGKNIFILRPGLREFLHSLIEYYELIVFTAGIKEYADQIINFIEKDEKYFSYRLYRESTTFVNNNFYYKDLNKLGRDLKKIIIVDDKQFNIKLQEENGIIIKPFITEDEGGKNDFILYNLINILIKIAKDKPDDIRESLKIYRKEIYNTISND